MKWMLKIIGGVLVVVLVFFVVQVYLVGNFYQITDKVYRSGQLYRHNLPYYLKKYRIKTVVNLTRGSLRDPDYVNELKIIDNLQVKMINYKMSASRYLTVQESQKLVNIMKTAKKPILIHCLGGSDRTSLASALYIYKIMGQSEKIAKQQFSVIYGHFPKISPEVLAMDKSFEDYVKYTQSQ